VEKRSVDLAAEQQEIQPMAQGMGKVAKETSPIGAKEEFTHTLVSAGKAS
jgi:hypothetical protein